MMEIIIGLSVAAVLVTWWVRARYVRPLRTVERMVQELAEGKVPAVPEGSASPLIERVSAQLDAFMREQQRLRTQITEEEFNLQVILSNMVEGVMVVDSRHIIRLANPSFIELFGLRSAPLNQSVLTTLLDASVEGLVRETLRTAAPQTREIFLTHQSRHLSVSAVPVQTEAAVTGVVAIFHDISRLKQLEDVRREFVANVSHELRTPLSIFHGYLENLMDNPGLPRKELGSILAVMKKHSLRLNALLEDLLTIARLEARPERLKLVPILVEPFLRGIIDDWAQKAKGMRFKLEIAPGLPPLVADRARMEQVLNNLLDNAVKYSDASGCITVSAGTSDSDIVLRVQDTGSGIAPDDLPHVFERFYRADKSRTRERGGTGLGLSIVKHLVQLHGGSVEVASRFGEGTTITLAMPLRNEAVQDEAAAVVAASRPVGDSDDGPSRIRRVTGEAG